MKAYRYKSGFLLVIIALVVGLSSMQEVAASTNSARIGIDISSQLSGVDCSGQTLLSVGGAVGTFFDGLRAGIGKRTRIDAFLVYSNQIVFSPDVDCTIDSTIYHDEDLIAYDVNAKSFSMFLDGSAEGIPARADIDAACFELGTSNLLLSFDTSVTLPGALDVADDDIVRYASGTFSKLHDGQELGFPESTDINALHHNDLGLFVSLDRTVTLGSATGSDEDIWCYDSASSNMTLSAAIGLSARTDLQSLDHPTDSDGDWLTDFEEVSGIDEAASTYPNTSVPLDPAGRTSEPDEADTDGDLMPDGAEAAAGTDPRDSSRLLNVIQARQTSASDFVLVWQSVPGRTYSIVSTTTLNSEFTNIIVGSYSAAGFSSAYTNSPVTAESRFYRIELVP